MTTRKTEADNTVAETKSELHSDGSKTETNVRLDANGSVSTLNISDTTKEGTASEAEYSGKKDGTLMLGRLENTGTALEIPGEVEGIGTESKKDQKKLMKQLKKAGAKKAKVKLDG